MVWWFGGPQQVLLSYGSKAHTSKSSMFRELTVFVSQYVHFIHTIVLQISLGFALACLNVVHKTETTPIRTSLRTPRSNPDIEYSTNYNLQFGPTNFETHIPSISVTSKEVITGNYSAQKPNTYRGDLLEETWDVRMSHRRL